MINSIIEVDEIDKTIFKVIYKNQPSKWEALDIKLFEIISKYFPLAFALHNDFIEKDRDKISYKNFISKNQCFIGIYEIKESFLFKKLKREYIALPVNKKFFDISFGTYWYLLLGKYEHFDYLWNSICNFNRLETTTFKSYSNPLMEKNFIKNETIIKLSKSENKLISEIREVLVKT